MALRNGLTLEIAYEVLAVTSTGQIVNQYWSIFLPISVDPTDPIRSPYRSYSKGYFTNLERSP